MENENVENVTQKANAKTILLVILLLIIMLLGVYLVYDKFLKKESTPAPSDNSNTRNYITDFTLLPKKSDSTAMEVSFASDADKYFTSAELLEDVMQKSTTANGFIVDFTGKSTTNDGEKCYKIDAKIDKVLDIKPYDTCNSGCSESYKVIKTSKYYIVGRQEDCTGYGDLTIYDITGKEVYKNEKTLATSDIVVVDNVLYFNVSAYPKYWQSYMDLTLDSLQVISINELDDPH